MAEERTIFSTFENILTDIPQFKLPEGEREMSEEGQAIIQLSYNLGDIISLNLTVMHKPPVEALPTILAIATHLAIFNVLANDTPDATGPWDVVTRQRRMTDALREFLEKTQARGEMIAAEMELKNGTAGSC